MKPSITVLLLFQIVTGLSQPENYYEEIKYVQAFTNDSVKSPIYIYDKQYGAVVDSVMPAPYGLCYTLVLINAIDGDWVKIESIYHAPCPSDSALQALSGKWIYNTELYFDLSTLDDYKINIYKQPSKNKVLTTFSGFQTVRVVDTNGAWALVEFYKDSAKLKGWVHRFDQCAYRWTACNWDVYIGP